MEPRDAADSADAAAPPEEAAPPPRALCVVAEPFLSGSHAQLCETLASRKVAAEEGENAVAELAADKADNDAAKSREDLREGDEEVVEAHGENVLQGGDQEDDEENWPEVQIVGWEGAAKWHWRMLVSAAYFAQAIPRERTPSTIVLSAMMNVAELLGLRPDLQACKKVLYFHENQLEYPRQSAAAAQSQGQSAFNLGWNQIVSCLCVDVIVFNSQYNMDSFFKLVGPFINKAPSGSRPPAVDVEMLRAKSQVLGVPIKAKLLPTPRDPSVVSADRSEPLRVVWPHRFEHDKGCEEWISVLEEYSQLEQPQPIEIYVLGETSGSAQDAAQAARDKLESLPAVNLIHWGRLEDRAAYLDLLRRMDVAVSTAQHEFYGVAMLEAATCGCLPLCPDRLSYPELFPAESLYRTRRQLIKRLRDYASRPGLPAAAMNAPAWHERLSAFQWGGGRGALARRWKVLLGGGAPPEAGGVVVYGDHRAGRGGALDGHVDQQHAAGSSQALAQPEGGDDLPNRFFERFANHHTGQAHHSLDHLDHDHADARVGMDGEDGLPGRQAAHDAKSTGSLRKTYKLAQIANTDPAIKDQRLDQTLQHSMVQMPALPGRSKRPKRHCILCCRRCAKGEDHRYREGRQTTWKCSVCNVNLCKACFGDFHRLPELVRPACLGGPKLPAEVSNEEPSLHAGQPDAHVSNPPPPPASSAPSMPLPPVSEPGQPLEDDALQFDGEPARKKRTRNRFKLASK